MFGWIRQRFTSKTPFEKKLYAVLGFYPKRTELYRQALTHKSYKGKGNPHNERLEFLGDAILGSIVAEILYEQFPQGKEGFLTQMRSKIVSRKTLNRIGANMGLKKLVRYHRSSSFHTILGNALEALVGAVYMDVGHEATKAFVWEKLLSPNLDLERLTQEEASYKSRVLEWGQKSKKKVRFHMESSTGLDHQKTYFVSLYIEEEKVSSGEGSSIKKAEERAAEAAQNILRN